MVEDKDTEIKYIRSEENPADIMTKNCSKKYYVKHMKSITEGEIWEILENGRDNVKNIGVMYEMMEFDNTEYYSHALAEVVDGENSKEWILVTRSRIGK